MIKGLLVVPVIEIRFTQLGVRFNQDKEVLSVNIN